MKAREITEAGKEALKSGRYQMVRINYANPDMVGHTGEKARWNTLRWCASITQTQAWWATQVRKRGAHHYADPDMVGRTGEKARWNTRAHVHMNNSVVSTCTHKSCASTTQNQTWLLLSGSRVCMQAHARAHTHTHTHTHTHQCFF
jgi:bisphosphoglycerate-independent phosphoglycerate mutase (AlkP superfamily)